MRPMTLLLGIVGATLAPSGLVSAPSGYTPIPVLIKEADVVAVAVISRGSAAGHSVSLTLEVERTLKGDPAVGSMVVEWDSPLERQAGALPAGERGLWFLRAVQPGVYRPVPAQGGPVLYDIFYRLPPLGAGVLVSYPTGSSALTKVILEITSAAEFYEGARGFSDRLLSALRSVEEPLLIPIYERFAASKSDSLRAVGLAGLIQQGEAGAVVSAEPEISSLKDPLARKALLDSIFQFRGTDPNAVRALGRMATAPNKDFYSQWAPIFALSCIHTREALPYLVALLDHPNPFFHSDAVAGLSLFAANIPITKPDVLVSSVAFEWLTPRRRRADSDLELIAKTRGPYETDETVKYFHMGPFSTPAQEAEYIGFWKRWWAENKTRLTQ